MFDYNIKVIYRKGEDQEAADFLSRNALEATDVIEPEFNQMTLDEIRKNQNEDRICQLI